jgi:hypothetical protein
VSATSTSILKCKPFLPSTAQAIAVPSIVDVPDQKRTHVSIRANYALVTSRVKRDVPRPSSSRTTNEFAVAPASMSEVSLSSTMKLCQDQDGISSRSVICHQSVQGTYVDRFRARSSEATDHRPTVSRHQSSQSTAAMINVPPILLYRANAIY